MSEEGFAKGFLDLVRENKIYKTHLREHKKCQSCLSCSEVKGFIELDKQNTFDRFLSRVLDLSHQDSPENLSFSTRLIEKVKCGCSRYIGRSDMLTVSLSISRSTEKTKLSEMVLSEINKKSGKHCRKPDCSIKNSTSKVRLQNLTNLIFTLNWSSFELSSLLNFLLSIEEELDLLPLFKNSSKVYFQGMVVANQSSSFYININPCVVYSTETELYLDYLNFFLIQYSLFPTVLVYNTEGPSDYSKISSHYQEELRNYVRFLSGQIEYCGEICFICWNSSDHTKCKNMLAAAEWTCECGLSNPVYSLFCNRCGRVAGLITGEISKPCNICGEILRSNYCEKCCVVGRCVTCRMDIKKTQIFGCFKCQSWVNSFQCEVCGNDLSALKMQCFSCFSQYCRSKYQCEHNKENVNCKTCLYDFSCAACLEAKFVYEKKFCWNCRKEVSGRFCKSCNEYLPACKIVCFSCANNGKTCLEGHLIRKYSENKCRSCEEEKNREIKREFCMNCGVDFNNVLLQNCFKCTYDEALHKCNEFSVCVFCVNSLVGCDCGAKLLSEAISCFNCKKAIKKQKTVLLNKDRGWKCLICQFSNQDSTRFCENCNWDKNEGSENWETMKNEGFGGNICGFCKVNENKDTCLKCFKISNCVSCSKNIFTSQEEFCCFCKEKLVDRFCLNCKSLSSRSKVLCYKCSLGSWVCGCSYLNYEKDICTQCSSV